MILFLFGRTNECPGYDIKPFDDESPVKLEFWGMRSTPSLPSLQVPLWLGVVVPENILSMSQIELFDIQTVLTNDSCKIE